MIGWERQRDGWMDRQIDTQLDRQTNNQLVGGWATHLKNMKVNWDDDIPNING